MQRTYDWFKANVEGFEWDTHRVHPIIIYGDKIGTNSRQRYSSEPWMFCHGGLKREHRNNPANWRPLGYMPDLDFGSSAKHRVMSGRKHGKSYSRIVYMKLMKEVVKSLKDCMGVNGSFKAFQRVGNEYRWMQHHVVVALVMGDSLSNSKLCGNYLSFNAS